MTQLDLLEKEYVDYKEPQEMAGFEASRLDFLGNVVFNFTTCDTKMSELFATKAVEVCEAISNKTTFDYIENEDNYQWFLLMCNMPFFANMIVWGNSIRGAWWGDYNDDRREYIEAIIKFAKT